MPYTAIKEARRHKLTLGMVSMAVLMATTCISSGPAPMPLGKRSHSRFFEEYDRAVREEEEMDDELLDYAHIFGALKRKRSEPHRWEVPK